MFYWHLCLYEMELFSCILCYVLKDTEYSSIYSALSDLRDQKRNLEEKFSEVQDMSQQVNLMSRLRDVNLQIDEQLNHRRKR